MHFLYRLKRSFEDELASKQIFEFGSSDPKCQKFTDVDFFAIYWASMFVGAFEICSGI